MNKICLRHAFVVAAVLSAGFFQSVADAAGTVARIDSAICLNPMLERQPIQVEGRVVPLFAYAQNVRRQLFPSKTCPQLTATALYCLLSLGKRDFVEEKYSCQVRLKVDHRETRALLGIGPDEPSVGTDAARDKQRELLDVYHALENKGEKSGGRATDLSKLLVRIEKFDAIDKGQDWKILGSGGEWESLVRLQWAAGEGAEGAGKVEAAVLGSLAKISPTEARDLKIETVYEKTVSFVVAIFVCLAGFLFSLLSIRSARFRPWAVLSMGLLLGTELFGITLRVLVSGRAPVTNMYETVMLVGIGSFILGVIVGAKFKDWRIWALAFFSDCLALFMMKFATGMLDGSIEPLVPVLRDNFWLSTHVTTVTLSYACFALSWIISNFVLIRWLSGMRNEESIQVWNHMIRIVMQVGTVFLAAGVILGGIWADYSWGRFWGWDPKETWSLIALVVYMLILHGRYAGWFKDIVFTMMAAVSFLFVLMAWFGVNYILSVGLHSYGFSSGDTVFLLVLFTAQAAFLATAGMVFLRQKA